MDRRIEEAVAPLGGRIEHMGGGLTAWWFDIDTAASRYALLTYYEGDHEGPPEAPHWMAGLYDGAAGEQLLCHDALSFHGALARVIGWSDEARRLRNASGCQDGDV